jgi:hypothetical protein
MGMTYPDLNTGLLRSGYVIPIQHQGEKANTGLLRSGYVIPIQHSGERAKPVLALSP